MKIRPTKYLVIENDNLSRYTILENIGNNLYKCPEIQSEYPFKLLLSTFREYSKIHQADSDEELAHVRSTIEVRKELMR